MRDETRRACNFLIKSLPENGFAPVEGSVADLSSWGASVILRREPLLLRITNDRDTLAFELAATCEPDDWHLFYIVRDLLNDAELTDLPEPAPQDVIAFLRDRGDDLANLFAPATWPTGQTRIQEREQAQTAFMVKLLNRR